MCAKPRSARPLAPRSALRNSATPAAPDALRLSQIWAVTKVIQNPTIHRN
jgi:hypothetical protein